jgi:crotonobetaine/carnitine-CoA ligase
MEPAESGRERTNHHVERSLAEWHRAAHAADPARTPPRRADPDGEYLDVCATKLSARQVHETASRLANALAELGRRSRATGWPRSSRTRPRRHLSWWGAVQAGAISVPINTAYKGEYLRHQLADSGSKVLVVEASLAERASDVLGQIDGLDHLVVIGEADLGRPPVRSTRGRSC